MLSPTRSRALPRPATFVLASAALVAVFASSGSPIPLYNTYRTADGLGNSALAVTTSTYLAVTALALLVLGRLSDHVGRKPVAIGALLSSAAGCLLLTQVHTLPVLLGGRVLQGLACGAAAAAIGSYVVDTAPRAPRWLAPVITGNAPPFSIPLGALVSGTLVQFAPSPRALVFEVLAAVLVVLAGLLALAPETAPRRPGALASLRPAVTLPKGPARATLIVAMLGAYLATWSFGGFYQSFAPAITADHLGTDSPIAIAMVFASVTLLSPFGGALTGRLRPATAVRGGLATFVVAAGTAVGALYAGAIWVFLGASLVLGLAMGAASTGTMRTLLAGTAPARRAGLLSAVYLVSYLCAAGPSLLAGAVAPAVDLTLIAIAYVVLVAVAATVAIAAVGRVPRERAAAPERVAVAA